MGTNCCGDRSKEGSEQSQSNMTDLKTKANEYAKQAQEKGKAALEKAKTVNYKEKLD